MKKSTESDEHVHIIFPLTKDTDGYPPVDSERLWAKKIDDELFEIDNVPFFVKGLSCGDRVTVNEINGVFYYKETKEYSGHSTIRVIIYNNDKNDQEEVMIDLRKNLESLGCTSEVSHIPNLLSVDVPEGASLEKVTNYLRIGAEADQWDYEEAALRGGSNGVRPHTKRKFMV